MIVFVAGSTGYLGSSLIPVLLENGHEVKALVRLGSESKLPVGCMAIRGDALDSKSYIHQLGYCDVFAHLVVVPHPGPSKAELFRSIDLKALRASVEAAMAAGISHFVYVSVAHPAPVMKGCVESRKEGESAIRHAGLNTTILRPWYVLGPGHRWAYSLVPFYWVLEKYPGTAETSRRLGLVTLKQMTAALAFAVNHPVSGVQILDVPAIRRAHL